MAFIIEGGYDGPSPPSPVRKLTALVSAGDARGVRAYFDDAFWSGSEERPAWVHLKAALEKEDRVMTRLLCTWGAAPGEGDLARLQSSSGEKYAGYRKALRAAGLSETLFPAEDRAPEPDKSPEPGKSYVVPDTASQQPPGTLPESRAWAGNLSAAFNKSAPGGETLMQLTSLESLKGAPKVVGGDFSYRRGMRPIV